jgi:hypothetical protein
VGQDPYGSGGDFTPYQPGEPSGEGPDPGDGAPPAAPPPEEHFVPYGTALPTTAVGAPAPAGPQKKQVWPWVVVAVVVLAVIGGCLGGIVSVFGSDSSSDTDLPKVIGANDLEEDQCLRGAGLAPDDDSGVSGLEVVDCGASHEAEVMAIQVLSAAQAADYDFDDSAQIDKICPPRFSEEERPLLHRADLSLIAFTASRQPVQDDKVVCLLVKADGSSFRGRVIDLPTPSPSS